MFLSKYGVARHIYIPIVKRAVVDFAVSADWTPAAGDVKISKDGGAAANVTNLPTAIAMGNGAYWDFSITATEMQAAQVVITVADAATKAVEDQAIVIETYGNASAQHPFDLATATVVASSVTAVGSGAITSSSFAASAINAAAIASAAITAAKFGTDAIDNNALADNAVTEMQTGLVVRRATAQAGAASTITLDASASATDSLYIGLQVVISSGTGAGQARLITGYVGSTKVATVASAWATNPDNTSVFALVPNRSLVSSMGTDTVDANALKTDAVTEIQTGLATSAALATVQADTDDIQTRLPAALVSGRIDASVGAMAANTVTSSAIATDAIGAAELAADAVTEIQSGLATAATQTTLAAAVAGVQADTDDIQTRIPAALVGGRMDSSVGAMASNVVTAAAMAADAGVEISDAVWAKTMTAISAVPGVTSDVISALEWLFTMSRNRRVQTTTTDTVYRDDETTPIAAATVSDNPTTATFVRGEYA